jgi:hypothetical protein
MRIRCECGREFVTPEHDEAVNFAKQAVVGPLGPTHVRNRIDLSEAHTCPHCGKNLYFVMTIELTHMSTDEKHEFERFMLRYYQRGARVTFPDTPPTC